MYKFLGQSIRAFALVLLAAGQPARADTVDLTSATIQDINAAFDAGTLNSEQLVKMFLTRIKAYDAAGPNLSAVITLNPDALGKAKKLDAERKRSGPRSPLHGIPIVLKDNLDTGDMPTTAGSFMLKGSTPPDDALVVQKLRAAGAIVLAKVDMGEFAIGGESSSMGGRTRNPHNPEKSPGGSSAGTGVAIAAAYAMAGLGTDTGGSVRLPSSLNGIVGLKTTHGLVSLDGVVPLALTLDTVGPMARSVHDVAAMLGVMAGVDGGSEASREDRGKGETNYVQYLNSNALQGARIGVARDFMGHNVEVNWITEAAIETMKRAGATVTEVTFPDWFIRAHYSWGMDLIWSEFGPQIQEYLATLGDAYPKTLDELIARSMKLTSPGVEGLTPNPWRWATLANEHKNSALVEPYQYEAIYKYAMPLARFMVESAMAAQNLDAIVYPTSSSPAGVADVEQSSFSFELAFYQSQYGMLLANLAGFPELAVPAGFTEMGMPVTVSFLGKAFSEPKLLALGYAFEQRQNARRLPVSTPALSGEIITTD